MFAINNKEKFDLQPSFENRPTKIPIYIVRWRLGKLFPDLANYR